MIPTHIRREIKRAADGARNEAVVRFDNHGPHDQMGATLWNLATHLQEQVLDVDQRESTARFHATYGDGPLAQYLTEGEALKLGEAVKPMARGDAIQGPRPHGVWLDEASSYPAAEARAIAELGRKTQSNEIDKLVKKLRDRVEEQMAAQLAALPEDQRAWLGQKWIAGEVELSVVSEEPEMHASDSYTIRAEIRPRLRRHKIDADMSEIYGRHRIEEVGLDIFVDPFTEPEMTVIGKSVVVAPQTEVPDPPVDHPHNTWAWNCTVPDEARENGDGRDAQAWCLACSGGHPDPDPGQWRVI